MVKIGQQLSMRMDILPVVYCNELSGLLDRLPSFDVKKAIRIIENQTNKKLQDIFKFFDREPVGSASIACVYKAELRSGGDKVAVKVRRPGIAKKFTADLAALDWIMKLMEFLTIIRPGVSENFRSEIRQILLEELDFRVEARYQELFRHYFKKRKELKVTAPKVYYDLSGDDVIVSEFVTGTWMTEILAAIELNDEEKLEYLRSQKINPRTIAKRLIWASFYGFFECPFFYGDPHPANIAVQPPNKIVMVDFGACGVFSERERNLLRQMHYYYSKDDVGGMVQSVIGLMEPLPLIDMDKFAKQMEYEWWHAYYGIKSKHTHWLERTSFRLWRSLLDVVREHQIPLPSHVLRMIRATLLYDTLAARLYNEINVFDEYQKYNKDFAKRTRQRIQKQAINQLLCGPDDSTYVILQRIWDTGQDLHHKLQKFLDQPVPNFTRLANKISDVILILFKLVTTFILLTIGAALIGTIFYSSLEPWYRLDKIVLAAWEGEEDLRIVVIIWLSSLLLYTFSYARRILWRLGDRDV